MIIDFKKIDLSDYSTTEEVEEMIEEAISGIDLSNYWTSAETQEAIDEAISGIDLSAYWTSAETQEAIDEAISEIDLTDIENDIATISGKVQTDEEVISTALNEIHDSLNNFVSSGQVETMIDAAISGIDLSNYYTSAETQSAIDEGVGTVSDRLDDVERVTSIALNELHDSLDNFVSSGEVETMIDEAISEIDLSDIEEDIATISGKVQTNEEVVSTALNDLNTRMNGMVSGNGITSIVGISQSDYADLVSGGTVDNNCLYAIIENN